MTLEESKLHELNRFAKQIRLNTLECLNHLGFGHYGGSIIGGKSGDGIFLQAVDSWGSALASW